jgi:quercetin dioxygenase-like cupin family protein
MIVRRWIGMLVAQSGKEAVALELPGRTWSLLIGPGSTPSKNLTVGTATFPPGSAPPGHVHPAEEEVIVVSAGRGWLRSPDQSVRLEAGTAVLITPGTFHSTEADPDTELRIVTIFSPPVLPGSYENSGGGAAADR